ncbi:MAG: FAD-binding oxidoreductase, partial [Rhodospirillaceae bacterium]|nr:FAD-binding oxidoreductase [Rhodospirillaceae bacterium]
ITGSEGLLGIITEVTVRILQKPEVQCAILVGFPSSTAGGDCVANIVAAGIIPSAMEMMDRMAISAMEQFVHSGYPLDVESILIVELDGPEVEVDYLLQKVEAIAASAGSTFFRASNSEQERQMFWQGRMSAFPSVGRISPDYLTMDGTIPRHRLPEVLGEMAEMSKKYDLRVANVFHAGDGNLHPLILYDANKQGELEKAEKFGFEILKLCVRVGGVLSGEHGIGVEKRDLMGEMFSEIDLDQQQRLKCAFDPTGLMNPGKVYPTPRRCAEMGWMHVKADKLPFPDIPRF